MIDDEDLNELTEKQKMFCLEFLKDFNATRSAKAAGYSEKTAHMQGFENLRKPKIVKFINKIKGEIQEKCLVTITNIVEDLLDTREQAKLLKELPSRIKANELLGRHLGMFKEKVEIEGEVNLNASEISGTVNSILSKIAEERASGG